MAAKIGNDEPRRPNLLVLRVQKYKYWRRGRYAGDVDAFMQAASSAAAALRGAHGLESPSSSSMSWG